MRIKDLTRYERRRYIQNSRCPKCGLKVLSIDDFNLFKIHDGRCVNYIFIHERCLNEKEIQKETDER